MCILVLPYFLQYKLHALLKDRFLYRAIVTNQEHTVTVLDLITMCMYNVYTLSVFFSFDGKIAIQMHF